MNFNNFATHLRPNLIPHSVRTVGAQRTENKLNNNYKT